MTHAPTGRRSHRLHLRRDNHAGLSRDAHLLADSYSLDTPGYCVAHLILTFRRQLQDNARGEMAQGIAELREAGLTPTFRGLQDAAFEARQAATAAGGAS